MLIALIVNKKYLVDFTFCLGMRHKWNMRIV